MHHLVAVGHVTTAAIPTVGDEIGSGPCLSIVRGMMMLHSSGRKRLPALPAPLLLFRNSATGWLFVFLYEGMRCCLTPATSPGRPRCVHLAVTRASRRQQLVGGVHHAGVSWKVWPVERVGIDGSEFGRVADLTMPPHRQIRIWVMNSDVQAVTSAAAESHRCNAGTGEFSLPFHATKLDSAITASTSFSTGLSSCDGSQVMSGEASSGLPMNLSLPN